MLRGHMKCCPSDINIFLLKGHTIPYLVRNVWDLVRNIGSLTGVPLIVRLPPTFKSLDPLNKNVIDMPGWKSGGGIGFFFLHTNYVT